MADYVEMGAVEPGPERGDDKEAEGGHHGDATDVVDPFAEGETAAGAPGEEQKKAGEQDGDDGFVFRQTGGARAEEIADFTGNLEEQESDDDETVGPDVPGGEEAERVAEGAAGPDVEAAFEGHFAVEIEDGDGHGDIEEAEGDEPGDELGAAETGGDADPGAADDGEDLGEDEVAEAHLAGQMMRFGDVCGGRGLGCHALWCHGVSAVGLRDLAGAGTCGWAVCAGIGKDDEMFRFGLQIGT